MHREAFGTDILDAPLESWPTSYPDVAQAKYLISEGVRLPMIATLTRIADPAEATYVAERTAELERQKKTHADAPEVDWSHGKGEGN